MITFLNPNFLFLIPIIFLILFYFYFIKKSHKNNFRAFSDLEIIYKNNTWYYKLYYLLIFIILTIGVLFLANPVKSLDNKDIKRDLFDIRIVFDLSYSMLANDFEPTRLELAKKSIEKFLNKIDNSNIGIIGFSGIPYELVKPTTDYGYLKDRLVDLNIGLIDQNKESFQGSNLGGALIYSANTFSGENNSIILFTDGSANRGYPLRETIKYLKHKNVGVYVIGIGGEEDTEVTIIDDSFGTSLTLPVEGLDEETLTVLANSTGGEFYKITDSNSFENIIYEIYQTERNKVDFKKYISFRGYLIILLVMLIVITSFYKRKKLKNI